ncbi:MAG: hypothetical protein GXP31_18075 [Kiritimatiellaeota bacterium]|nr:hypothetical protein [Kiritimatiellota bacterium]
MRSARIRYDRELCYYHLLNRVAGERSFFPFGDVEKEQFFRLALHLTKLYTVELLSLVVMSNHYHIVCAAPTAPPGKEEIQRRWRAYYGEKKIIEPNWDDPDVVAAWGARMRDIACFLKDLQQRYTSWFNRTRPTRRRGTLWADRYKNVILEGETALWDCIRYVEMNPVRARICADPAEYRFSTWGRFAGSGRHPFRANVVRHLRRYLGERARGWTGTRVLAELNADMARVAASERGETEETFAAEGAGRKAPAFVLTVRRRVRYWSDGAIIGSKLFVRNLGAELINRERAPKKRLARSRSPGGGGTLGGLYSWRLLRVDVQ